MKNNIYGMKSAFVISSYPSNQTKIDWLKDTINCVKGKGFDIVLCTNLPIKDDEIYSSVDYFIYDKLDVKSFTEMGLIYPEWGQYFQNDIVEINQKFDNAYHFDLYRCMYNSVSLLNGLKYDFFYYIEGDSILDDSEMNQMINIRDRMFRENKNMVFVQHHVDGAFGGYYMYQTMFFGGKPSFFMKNINIPFELKDWINIPYLHGTCLELIFFDKLKMYSNEMLILDKEEWKLKKFNNSKKIDEFYYKEPFFFEKDKPDIIHFFITSNFIISQKIYVKMFMDNVLYRDLEVRPGWYHIWNENVNFILNKKIKQIVYSENNVEILNVENIMTPDRIDFFRKTKEIKFK